MGTRAIDTQKMWTDTPCRCRLSRHHRRRHRKMTRNTAISRATRRSFLKTAAATLAAAGAVDGSGVFAQSATETPGSAQPAASQAQPKVMIVDSHCHATPIWYSDADALLFELDRNAVAQAIITQIENFFD